MTQEELREVCQKWQEENEDRAVILIATEGKEHKKMVALIGGKKSGVELALFNFIKKQAELVTGMINDLLGDIMKEKKNDGVSDNKTEGQE